MDTVVDSNIFKERDMIDFPCRAISSAYNETRALLIMTHSDCRKPSINLHYIPICI